MLKPRQAVGNRAHVAAALHIVLPAQRIEAASIATDVSREQPEVDQRQHVVDRVVMLGDAQRPANLRALGLGIRMRRLPNRFRRHPGLAFRALEPQSRMTSVSSTSRYELVPPPAPKTVARPTTLGACQVRLQLSILFVPITERTNFCAT